MTHSILYYATNAEVPGYLNEALQSKGYKMTAYTIGEEIREDIFILFSPVWHHEHFISCDLSWKQYFQKEKPDLKFITAGFREASQPNYIDLIKLPNDFTSFFDKALSAREDWTPVNTGGLDMQAKLERFFEGHGIDSVEQVLSPIGMKLEILKDKLTEGISFEELQQNSHIPKTLEDKLTVFNNRFSNYYCFFECLPFFEYFQKIFILKEKLDNFFQKDNKYIKLFAQIEDAILLFREIESILAKVKKYVY